MWRLALPALLVVAIIAAVVAADRPRPRADLTYVDSSPIQTLDPQGVSFTNDMRVCYALYEGLLRWDNDTFDIRPAVAREWRRSEDRRTYTFLLRPEARWSNGDPVRAADFVHAWRRALLPDLAADYSSMFFLIEGGEAFFRWRADELGRYAALPAHERTPQAAAGLWRRTEDRFRESVGLHAPDDHTLVVTLARPAPYFLDLVCFAPFLPVHPPTVERFVALDAASGRLVQLPDWTKPEHAVGNGPLMLVDWRFKRDLRLERNPAYWNPAEALVGSVSVRTMENPNTAALAFETGAVDWVADADRVEHVADLVAQARAGERDDVHWFQTFGVYFWSFNCSPTLAHGATNPFADPLVRRAFTLATDRSVITDKVRRLGEPVARSFVPPGGIEGYEPPDGLPFDPDAARALFAQAGWLDRDGDGRPENERAEPFPVIELLCATGSYHESVALTMGDMWERTLGVRTRLLSKESRAVSASLLNRDYMMARGVWYGDYGDPLTFLDVHRTGDGNNDRGYSNAEYDGLLARADAEPDPAARFALLREAERLIVERDCPVLPVFFYVQFTLFRDGALRNYSTHPRMVQHIWELEPAP